MVRSVAASSWTDEDRKLMLAYRIWRDSLCRECGTPRDRAWHPDMDGWYEVELITCHACTAVDSVQHTGDGPAKPREYPQIIDTRDYVTDPLPTLRKPDRGP